MTTNDAAKQQIFRKAGEAQPLLKPLSPSLWKQNRYHFDAEIFFN